MASNMRTAHDVDRSLLYSQLEIFWMAIINRVATLSTHQVKIARWAAISTGQRVFHQATQPCGMELSRLTDIELGFLLAVQLVGN